MLTTSLTEKENLLKSR